MAFGAQIKLSVDQSGSAQAAFRREIQAMVDSATSGSPVKIKQIQIDLSSGEKQKAIGNLQNSFNDSALTLKIKEIDASEAVTKLKGDLSKMLSGLKITGLKDFMGSEEMGKALAEAIDASAKKAQESMGRMKQETIEVTAALKELKQVDTQLKNINNTISGFGDTDKAEELLSKYREILNLTEMIRKDPGDTAADDVAHVAALTRELRQQVNAYRDAENAATKKANTAKAAAKVEKDIAREMALIQQQLNSAYKAAGKLEGEDSRNEIAAQYRALTAELEAAKALSGDAQREEVERIAESASALDRKAEAYVKTQREAEKTAKTVERLGGAEAAASAEADKAAKAQATFAKQVSSARTRIQSFIDNNSRAMPAYGASLQSLLSQLSAPDIDATRLKQIVADFSKIEAAAKDAGLAGKTFWDKLTEGWQKFGGWAIVTKSMMAAMNSIRKMVDSVKQLDAAMTELKKVTDLTDTAYSNFLKQATSTAKSIGATISDTVNATADFARLGYDLEDAAMLAKSALTYKNIGDGIQDVSVASESLISTIKAFGLEAENATHIVDAFNEVGKLLPMPVVTR